MAVEWVTDTELLDILKERGLPLRDGRVALAALARNPRFPRKDMLFGGRRFLPAIDAFLHHRYGLRVAAPTEPDGEENWNSTKERGRSRTQP